MTTNPPNAIEAARAEFREWLQGWPLTNASKDMIAGKFAELCHKHFTTTEQMGTNEDNSP